MFRIPAGQKLNVTLMDFSRRQFHLLPPSSPSSPNSATFVGDEHDAESTAIGNGGGGGSGGGVGDQDAYHRGRQPSLCRPYAVVSEPSTGVSVTICGGHQPPLAGSSFMATGGGSSGGGGMPPRERLAYTSRSNLVHLQLAAAVPSTGSGAGGGDGGAYDPVNPPLRFIFRFEGTFSGAVSVLWHQMLIRSADRWHAPYRFKPTASTRDLRFFHNTDFRRSDKINGQ